MTDVERHEHEHEEGEEKIKIWRQICYGVGNFGRYIPVTIQSFYINPYLLEVGQLSTFTVGTILLIAQIWDGSTDPLVGRFSDLTRTRIGRRKPFIFLAVIPSAIFWTLLWRNPDFLNGNEIGKAIYFTIGILAFSTMNTCVSVPYFSLVPYVTKTQHDRTNVAFFQQLSGMIAGMLFSFLTGVFIDAFGSEKGYTYSAFIDGVVIIFFAYFSVFFIKEKLEPIEQDAKKKSSPFIWGLLTGIVSALSLKEFRMVVSIFVLSVLAIFLTVNNIYLFVEYVVEIPEQSSIVILVFQLSVTVSFFFWAFLTKKIGKKKVYFFGSLLWAGSLLVLFFIEAKQVKALYILIILRGLGSGVGYLIPYVMLPDAIELDAKKTGARREGLLFSIFILFQKVGLAIGISFSNYALGFAGYQDNAEEQLPEVLLTLRALTCLVPIFCLIFAVLIVYFYPNPKKPSSRAVTVK